jgi:AcrR family transcriptional regulator
MADNERELAEIEVPEAPAPSRTGTRRRRSDGERSRGAILATACRLATVEGLNGLTIGRLADAVGMSKSGLYAHFDSKEELQLATVDRAREVFDEQVLDPAAAEQSGLERLRALCERFLEHVERGVYPGGCFFASATAELDTQPGRVRDSVLAVEDDYLQRLHAAAADAQADGTIAAGEDVEQLVFELNAYLLLANAQFVLVQERGPMDRAREAIERRLELARPPG